MTMKEIAVVGSGAMGSGIAQVSAMRGYNVMLEDIGREALDSGKASIEKSLTRMMSKGNISEPDVKSTLARIQFTSDLEEACRNADLVVEAVFEDLQIKHQVFKEFNKICKPECIMASNTSAIPITEIAMVATRPEKVVGIHFMNPVPIMKGVEVIKGQLTSDETMQITLDYIKSLGKEPVLAVDFAGFIASRLIDVLINEAVKLVQEGNKPEDIDKAMELCAGHPMGPCRLLDLVGADIAIHGMERMEKDFGEKYKPHPLLRKRVLAGLLGQKTGRGFYQYSKK